MSVWGGVEQTLEKRIGIGLVGAGAIMRLSHAPTIARSNDARLVGVFDADLQRAQELAERFGANVYPALEAMLATKDVDAVIVATPNRDHPQSVIAAAAAGKHVLCEKPLAID